MHTDPLSSYLDTLAPLEATGFGSSGDFSAFEESGLGRSTAERAASGEEIASIAAKTTDKGYRRLVRHINTTSYSILEQLHSCPRAFALDKIKANVEVRAGVPEPLVKDFVYGHAVGAGAQGLLASGNNLVAGQFAAFVSWAAPLDAWEEDGKLAKTKTFVSAFQAVNAFHQLLKTDPELANYEVLMVTINGVTKPAIELAFCLDTGDGYQYYGHIDAVVRNRATGRVAIFELKTTALTTLQPAMYANSNQALGYAVILDLIAPQHSDFEVIYASYQVGLGTWHVLPFAKSRAMRAEWVQDLLLDHQRISSYRQLNHFPKNGSACTKFNRVCRWFGECDFINKQVTNTLPVLDLSERAEEVDYYFTLSQILSSF